MFYKLDTIETISLKLWNISYILGAVLLKHDIYIKHAQISIQLNGISRREYTLEVTIQMKKQTLTAV